MKQQVIKIPRITFLRLVVGAVLLLSVVTTVSAQDCQDVFINAPDPLAGEGFGKAVNVDGTTLVVGAPGLGNGSSPFPGRAFVYTWEAGAWEYRATLSDRNGVAGDVFGYSVAIDGDVIVVGAMQARDASGVRTGKALVFNRGTGGWSTTATPSAVLTAQNRSRDDLFGAGVAVSNDWILVGAPRADIGAKNSGAVFAFQFNGFEWVERQCLTQPDPLRAEHFGLKIALDGNLAVIGAPNIHWHSLPGTVHVFRLDRYGQRWKSVQTLHCSDPTAGDHFGRSLGLLRGPNPGDHWLVVGATGDDDLGGHSGSVFVFRAQPSLSGYRFVQTDKLIAENGSPGDHFGFSSAISNGLIVVGAQAFDKQGMKNVGTVYVFEPREENGEIWNQTHAIVANCTKEEEVFGMTTAFFVTDSGAIGLLAGVPGRDPDGIEDAGAVQVFSP